MTLFARDAAGDLVLSAEAAARLLGAPLPALLADLREGRVFSLVERGEGEDAGRLRATLRWRGAEARVVLDAATGAVIAA